MKKCGIYIFFILLLVLGAGCVDKPVSVYISLDRYDKNPYGTYVFYKYLDDFFGHRMLVNNKGLTGNALFADSGSHKIYIIMQPRLYLSPDDAASIEAIVAQGHDVFICSFNAEEQLAATAGAATGMYNADGFPMPENNTEGMAASVEDAAGQRLYFNYPGARVEGSFNRYDSLTGRPLAYGTANRPHLLAFKKGRGHLYLHTSPLCFSNYFLLTANNEQYFENIFSRMPAGSTVVWDAYLGAYTPHHKAAVAKPGWLASIMKYPALRAGILTALCFLLLFILTEMRRRRRMVPVIEPPKNESLDFVKAIGLLYFEKKDNLNLAQKMSAYFMEYVRNRYKVLEKNDAQAFVTAVSTKSGAQEKLVQEIAGYIRQTEAGSALPDEGLIQFKQRIEEFYQY